jgi:hypothetical protein
MAVRLIARSLLVCFAVAAVLTLALFLLDAQDAFAWSGPQIEYVSHEITADSINQDGVANPGEMVYVAVTVRNTGTYTAFDLQGSLYSDSFYAECYGVASYGDLGPGEERTSQGELYFRLSPRTPDGYTLDLTFWLTDFEGGQYFPQFSIPVVDSVGPALSDFAVDPKVIAPTGSVTLTASMLDGAGVEAVTATVRSADNTFSTEFPMYDDGAHGDGEAGDDTFGAFWSPSSGSYDFVAGFEATDGLGNYREHPDKVGFSNRQFSRHSTILVVIDELNEPGFDDYYTSALAANGFAYDLWHPFYRGPVPGDVILNYVTGIVIWATPEQGIVNDPDVYSARDTLVEYLDEGGKLFITGQDIGYYIHDQPFYQDYLHAQFVQDSVGLYNVRGIPGDEIGDGMDFEIAGTGSGADNQEWPSEINAIAPAERVFEYYVVSGAGEPLRLSAKTRLEPRKALPILGKGKPGEIQPQGVVSSGTAALRIDTGVYKVVYFAFGFEGIQDADDREAVMGSVVEWLHGRSTFEKTLVPGWNLVSLPVIPDSTAITDVLASIAGRYSLVQTYDAGAQTWKSYDPGLPPEGSTLLVLDERTPFWIDMTAGGALTVSGILPISTDQDLKTGWNMVAYPCSETRTISNAFASIGGKYTKVYRYEAGTSQPWRRYDLEMPSWARTLTDAAPGWGYWMYITEDCTLTIVN